MTKKELKSSIEASLKKEGFIMLPRLEDRLISSLALQISESDSFVGIREYPLKQFLIKDDLEQNIGRDSYVDLVCFNKKAKNWSKENILWALEAKLFDPYQMGNIKKYLNKSLWGPLDDKKKLLKLGIKQFFILLYQVEIIDVPKNDVELKSFVQSFSYAGKSIKQIEKSVKKLENNNKDWFEELKKRCEDDFEIKLDTDSFGNVEVLPSFKIHFIINEIYTRNEVISA